MQLHLGQSGNLNDRVSNSYYGTVVIPLRQQGVDLSKVSNESRETILNHMKYVGALRNAKVNKADVITATRDLKGAERIQKYYTEIGRAHV